MQNLKTSITRLRRLFSSRTESKINGKNHEDLPGYAERESHSTSDNEATTESRSHSTLEGDVVKPATVTDTSRVLDPTSTGVTSTELEALYDRRAASLRQRKEIEEAMQQALLRAQENQQFYFNAQREYNVIDENIEADNERIREISNDKVEGNSDELPINAFVGAVLEMSAAGRSRFPQEWRDFHSDSDISHSSSLHGVTATSPG